MGEGEGDGVEAGTATVVGRRGGEAAAMVMRRGKNATCWRVVKWDTGG